VNAVSRNDLLTFLPFSDSLRLPAPRDVSPHRRVFHGSSAALFRAHGSSIRRLFSLVLFRFTILSAGVTSFLRGLSFRTPQQGLFTSASLVVNSEFFFFHPPGHLHLIPHSPARRYPPLPSLYAAFPPGLPRPPHIPVYKRLFRPGPPA